MTDLQHCYDLWSSRGAKFITAPKVHATELRCYVRDPQGYRIELGQTARLLGVRACSQNTREPPTSGADENPAI